jgi:ribonuclease P/MRP protein subunit RPP40
MSVVVAYIDFSKAFDTVSHNKLMTKLAAYGISGELLKWIWSFLSGRTQQTRVGYSLSAVAHLTSGIVQGSVLGPLLFVLYINNICDLFGDDCCVCKIYADDVKLYTILNVNDADCAILQHKLDNVCLWARTWQMTISYKKCNTMFIQSGRKDCNGNNNFVFRLGSNIVSAVNSVRDLGVLVDNNLNFHEHITKIVSQAFVRANLIHKCFLSKDARTLTRAFNTYVRPLLEYASVSWSPHHINDIKLLESVQRKFTKRLPGYSLVSYQDRLKQLNLESLELRRLRIDLSYTYKILFGLIDVNASDFFTLANNDHNTRGHAYKLSTHCSRLDIRKFYFSERVVKPWNNLQADPEHFSSFINFKRFLYKSDLTKFLIVYR